MKSGCLVICFFAVAISSCMWGKPSKKRSEIYNDTLTYKYSEYKLRAGNCGDQADSNCTVAKFKYPVFAKQKALNDTLNARFANMFQLTDTPAANMQALAKSFIGEYEKLITETNSTLPYSLDCYAKVIKQDSSLTVLETGGYSFTGGAHPSSFTGFINWNAKTNKQVQLKDLVDARNLPGLTRVAEGIFRKNEKLGNNSSLADNYFFKDDKFALTSNFMITPAGLRFLYNQYEIKPYAAGTTELIIPYAQIKSLLRPNTVVAQYIK